MECQEDLQYDFIGGLGAKEDFKRDKRSVNQFPYSLKITLMCLYVFQPNFTQYSLKFKILKKPKWKRKKQIYILH